MRPQEQKNLIKSGIFLCFLVFVVLIFVIFIGKENSLFSEQAILKGRLTNAQNLKPAAVVQLKGIKVGRIHSITIISQNEVEVEMEIDSKYMKWIKEDSYMSIETAGLVGDKYVEIRGGSSTSKTANPEFILSAKNGSALDRFVDQGETILVDVKATLRQLNEILSQFNKNNEIERAVKSFSSSSGKLQRILEAVDDGALKEGMDNFQKATGTLQEVSARIEQGPGTLHSLIYDRALYDQINTLMGGAKRNQLIRYFIRESIDSAKTEKQR